MRPVWSAFGLMRPVRAHLTACALALVLSQAGLIATASLMLCCTVPDTTAMAHGGREECLHHHDSATMCPMHQMPGPTESSRSEQMMQLCDDTDLVDMLLTMVSAPSVPERVQQAIVPVAERERRMVRFRLPMNLARPPLLPPPLA